MSKQIIMNYLKISFSFLLLLFLCLNVTFLSAQKLVKTIYYDNDNNSNEVAETNANYYAEVRQFDSLYHYTKFLISSKQVISKVIYKDTGLSEKIGIETNYYENGRLKDSSVYSSEFEYLKSLHYYPNGKLWIDYSYDPETNRELTRAFDDNGILIPDFIFMREASFIGGLDAWKKYIIKNVNSRKLLRRKPNPGMYKVIVKFIIYNDGSIGDILAETNFGYGVEEEAVRVVKLSGKWIPAIFKGETVRAYRRQPITFVF